MWSNDVERYFVFAFVIRIRDLGDSRILHRHTPKIEGNASLWKGTFLLIGSEDNIGSRNTYFILFVRSHIDGIIYGKSSFIFRKSIFVRLASGLVRSIHHLG